MCQGPLGKIISKVFLVCLMASVTLDEAEDSKKIYYLLKQTWLCGSPLE